MSVIVIGVKCLRGLHIPYLHFTTSNGPIGIHRATARSYFLAIRRPGQTCDSSGMTAIFLYERPVQCIPHFHFMTAKAGRGDPLAVWRPCNTKDVRDVRIMIGVGWLIFSHLPDL